MNKKIFTLALATFLIGISAAEAAPKPRPMEPKRPSPEMMEIKLIEQLKLTPEQYNTIQERRKADQEKIKPLMEKMKELHQQMNEIRKANMKAFEEILTPEQKAEFDKIKAERKARHEERMRKHPRPGMNRGHLPPEHMKRPPLPEHHLAAPAPEDAPVPMPEDMLAPMPEEAPAPTPEAQPASETPAPKPEPTK